MKATQKQIDKAFSEARTEWERMVSESGMTQAVFFASGGNAAKFIYEYNHYRDSVIADGFTAPELIEGMTIEVCDEAL